MKTEIVFYTSPNQIFGPRKIFCRDLTKLAEEEFVSVKPKVRMRTRVYIGGLPPRTREKDVERFLRKDGRIRDVLMKSR